jgi:hypothetical protein
MLTRSYPECQTEVIILRLHFDSGDELPPFPKDVSFRTEIRTELGSSFIFERFERLAAKMTQSRWAFLHPSLSKVFLARPPVARNAKAIEDYIRNHPLQAIVDNAPTVNAVGFLTLIGKREKYAQYSTTIEVPLSFWTRELNEVMEPMVLYLDTVVLSSEDGPASETQNNSLGSALHATIAMAKLADEAYDVKRMKTKPLIPWMLKIADLMNQNVFVKELTEKYLELFNNFKNEFGTNPYVVSLVETTNELFPLQITF